MKTTMFASAVLVSLALPGLAHAESKVAVFARCVTETIHIDKSAECVELRQAYGAVIDTCFAANAPTNATITSHGNRARYLMCRADANQKFAPPGA